MEEIYLTQEGYEKLSEELEYLKNVRRREIAKALEHARQLGDLSENAEYDAAKDAQAHNEARIAELENILSKARIIDENKVNLDEIRIGMKVVLFDLDFEETIEYKLVSEEEADYEQGKISITSPVGKALLGHKKNDLVEIKAPARVLRYRIEDIKL